MKVLALVTDAFGGYGGIAQYNRDLIRALASLDTVEAVTILPRRSAVEAGQMATGVQQLRPSAGRISYSFRAVLFAVRTRPDVIFCGHLFVAPLAWLIAKLLDRPWWLQVHGIEAWDNPSESDHLGESFPRWFSIRRLVGMADLVTAVSRHTRRRFLAWTDLPADQIKVLPNTYEPPARLYVSSRELRERYSLTGKSVLLTVSRLDRGDRYKGHDKIIDAMRELVAWDPTVKYVIVGDGDNRVNLERLALLNGVADAIHFAGRVSPEELENYYAIADVFVMPSSKEGFGIVFLEAALRGVPIIAGNRDGSLDASCDGLTARCINPDNRTDILEAIKAALRQGSKGSQNLVARFGPKNFRTSVARVVSHLHHRRRGNQ
ncbi:MAG TPA: glycosyltransferase family 4 protein [Verrucomicrobiae bacterium]|nr:glycosyltransferase family 4 protein [Verrucomicrobiae bacterium]